MKSDINPKVEILPAIANADQNSIGEAEAEKIKGIQDMMWENLHDELQNSVMESVLFAARKKVGDQ